MNDNLSNPKNDYYNMSIPELEKEYNNLLVLTSLDNHFYLYYSESLQFIKKQIKKLKDR